MVVERGMEGVSIVIVAYHTAYLTRVTTGNADLTKKISQNMDT